jgi:hypothetical protein
LPPTGGSTIIGYTIKILESDGITYSEDKIYCDGMNTLTIINTRTCNIPIARLISSPYNLPWGSSIYATLQAFNILSSSNISAPGNGAIIVIVPDPPVNLDFIS